MWERICYLWYLLVQGWTIHSEVRIFALHISYIKAGKKYYLMVLQARVRYPHPYPVADGFSARQRVATRAVGVNASTMEREARLRGLYGNKCFVSISRRLPSCSSLYIWFVL